MVCGRENGSDGPLFAHSFTKFMGANVVVAEYYYLSTEEWILELEVIWATFVILSLYFDWCYFEKSKGVFGFQFFSNWTQFSCFPITRHIWTWFFFKNKFVPHFSNTNLTPIGVDPLKKYIYIHTQYIIKTQKNILLHNIIISPINLYI